MRRRIALELFRKRHRTNLGFQFQSIGGLQADARAFHFFGRRFQTTASQISVSNGQTPEQVQEILKASRNSSIEAIWMALRQSCPVMTEHFALDVLTRNRSDWKLAHVFFKWLLTEAAAGGGCSPGPSTYNEILSILGKMHRFEELNQVLDILDKQGLANERTFGIFLGRFVAAGKVEEAVGLLDRRKRFGVEDDMVAFQMVLMHLCRYKHVEYAETLFYSKRREFGFDIKTLNIILNGWCVLGDVREAKRFWKDILASQCKPDLYTYATFIKALTKKGKLGSALKLFQGMWVEESCKPDVVICNCLIYALCFKKRIPEALSVFNEMGEKGCPPNTATYNSLVKHLCKIRRMEKVYEMLEEMEGGSGRCLPNEITFSYVLKSARKADEVEGIVKRMEKNGCRASCDTYNLLLRLYSKWDEEEKVRCTWDEMERSGLGPDRRAYTIMIHGLYEKGRIDEALSFFDEMRLKGMVPEPQTEILVNAAAMNTSKVKEQECRNEKRDGRKKPSRHRRKNELAVGL